MFVCLFVCVYVECVCVCVCVCVSNDDFSDAVAQFHCIFFPQANSTDLCVCWWVVADILPCVCVCACLCTCVYVCVGIFVVVTL